MLADIDAVHYTFGQKIKSFLEIVNGCYTRDLYNTMINRESYFDNAKCIIHMVENKLDRLRNHPTNFRLSPKKSNVNEVE